jgi:hypothetical protein
MIVGKTLPFITAYVEQLSGGMESRRSGAGLTAGRQAWLGFCLMCLIVTEALCWRKFVRASLGRYGEALWSWYFCGPISWDLLLAVSTEVVWKRFGTYEGVLVLDDSDKKRAKVTHRIPSVHSYKNKEGTGTVRGQEVLFLS